jgi:hypothetical protein
VTLIITLNTDDFFHVFPMRVMLALLLLFTALEELLYGNALSQVPWLIDISAQSAGSVIRQKL